MQPREWSLGRLPSSGRTVDALLTKRAPSVSGVLNVLLLCLFGLNGIWSIVPGSYLQLATKVSIVLFWACSIAAFLRIKGRIPWDLWTCRFAFAFLCWVLASVTWSTQPLSTTYSPAISSVCVFFYYCYVMDRFDPSRFKTLLFQMFTLMFIISLVTAVALPGRGRETASAEGSALANVGAWKGPYRQKNELGLNCALAFALCAGYRPKSSIERTWRTGLVLLTLLLSYKSQSRESWIAIAVICYLAVLIKPIRGLAPASRLPVVITLVVGAVTTVTLAYMNLDALLALVGRDRTLTGRSDIWNYSMIAAQRRPLLGYGIYGYWTTPNATEVVVRAGWKVTSSHNSYLDCVISYGLIGLMIYLPIPLSALAYIFRAILSYSIENLEMYIYMLTAIIVLSFGGGFLTLTPGISYVLAIYVISNLEKVERSGFMSLEP